MPPTDKQNENVGGRAEQTLAELTRRIVEAHEICSLVHRNGEIPLPSKVVISEILQLLFEMTSPGYHSRQRLNLTDAARRIASYAYTLRQKLIEQAILDLYNSSPPKERSKRKLAARAEIIIDAFMGKIPGLIAKLDEDITSAFCNDPAAKSIELIILTYPGIESIRTYRIANELHRAGLSLIPRVMTEIAHHATGIDIHPGATIGRRFFIDHGTGIVIGETATIGDDVVLFQGVTIGARRHPSDEHGNVSHNSNQKRHPTIGNRVTIYANATILGGDTTIGDDAIIGSSAWIEGKIDSGVIATNQNLIDRLDGFEGEGNSNSDTSILPNSTPIDQEVISEEAAGFYRPQLVSTYDIHHTCLFHNFAYHNFGICPENVTWTEAKILSGDAVDHPEKHVAYTVEYDIIDGSGFISINDTTCCLVEGSKLVEDLMPNPNDQRNKWLNASFVGLPDDPKSRLDSVVSLQHAFRKNAVEALQPAVDKLLRSPPESFEEKMRLASSLNASLHNLGLGIVQAGSEQTCSVTAHRSQSVQTGWLKLQLRKSPPAGMSRLTAPTTKLGELRLIEAIREEALARPGRARG